MIPPSTNLIPYPPHLLSMPSYLWTLLLMAILIARRSGVRAQQQPPNQHQQQHNLCGGYLNGTQGIIQTPNFPNKFPVPISCVWIIDASSNPSANVSIVIYLTQMYALNGLKFTEYMYYSADYKVPSPQTFEISEDNVTQVTWLKFSSPYLEVKFTMNTIHGTHLRALDRLLDVYGFNITYEVGPVKTYQCNALKCRFLGHCYATHNFSDYYCSCFPGFSGTDCGFGPLCKESNRSFCENGGICKHIGDAAVTCLCPNGFKGNKCDVPVHTVGGQCGSENADNCHRECVSNGGDDKFCKCRASSANFHRRQDRYEVTIRLGNSSLFLGGDKGNNISTTSTKRINTMLSNHLEKYINRFLRNSNITNVTDLEISKELSTGSDVTFHFFGSEMDGSRVRDAVNRLVERGRIGNFTLVQTYQSFRQEPGLQLQSVVVNQKSAIREKSEFILSCVAQGSPKMTFRWYKNGVFINITKATRNMWTRLLPLDSKNHYTALLGISKTSRLDEGLYTCQVADWGRQQCHSTLVYVLPAPQLRIDPPSVTLYRGESLRLRCLSPNNDHRYGPLGYSWTKNSQLFQSDPETEFWEDLYPDGSILNIRNIQKSAEYSCVVSNMVAPVSKSVYITVIDRGVVELCPTDKNFGVQWPASAPGPSVLADCPDHAAGQSRRICEQTDFAKPRWLQPDFSHCVPEYLGAIYNDFLEVTFGYQRSNTSVILQHTLEYAINRKNHFLPGEAAFLLRMLQEIHDYLDEVGSQCERDVASDTTLQILDIILKNEFSINNQQQVKHVQRLFLMAASNRESVATSGPKLAASTSNQLSSFRLHNTPVKALPFELQISGDQLFSDQLYLEINKGTTSLLDFVGNSTLSVTVISYRNLTSFLPHMYITRNRYDSSTNNQEAWNTDLCLTENLLENITRCICPISGTYVVLLARQNYNTSAVQTTTRPMFVILCCGCCFIQSCTAFAVLLPVLYHRKCSVTFLKMQFCTTTSTVMAIFTLGLVKLLPKDWSGVISSTLAGLLLMGSTTLIAIILIVQYEVGQQLRRVQSVNISSGLRGAIGLSWLLPILYAMCVPLVHSIVKMWPNNWWQEVGSFGFMLFVGTEILFVILFALLFFTLIRKLVYLSRKSDKHNSSIMRRIGLLVRTAFLYIVKLLTIVSFLIYMNCNEFINSCIFGLCCFILGSSILLCFVVKAEEKLKFEPVQKLKNTTLDENYYTGSINSPLSYFTNQDLEQDNEGVPPSGKVPMAILSTQSQQRCPMERLAPMSQQSAETFISAGSFSPLPSLDGKALNFDPPPGKSREKGDSKFPVAELQNHPSPSCGNYQVSPGKCFIQEPTEFVGVGGLDILQGVAPDTIVGIRARISSEAVGHQHHHSHHYHQHHRTTPDAVIIPSSPQPPLPIITVTSHEEDAAMDGMLDRISHDLDYLLNRTATPPETAQIVGRRKQGEAAAHFSPTTPSTVATIPISHGPASGPHPISHSVQEVIIEAAEE